MLELFSLVLIALFFIGILVLIALVGSKYEEYSGVVFPIISACLAIGLLLGLISVVHKATVVSEHPLYDSKTCLEEVIRNFPNSDVYTPKKDMDGKEWFLYAENGIYHIKTNQDNTCAIVYTKLMYRQELVKNSTEVK